MGGSDREGGKAQSEKHSGGKRCGWDAAAGGVDGAVRMLEIMEDELLCAMGLTGLQNLAQVNSKYVCHTEPVGYAHEMSSWVNMPLPRIV